MVQDYVIPETIVQALHELESWEGRARVMAGGTDLVLDLDSGKFTADCIVDITRLPGFTDISLRDGRLAIGGAVTHNQALHNPLIQKHAYALAKASGCVGSHQIRNVSTISGNIISAQPAADSAVALAALDASVRIQDLQEIREFSMSELYAGFGKSTVDSTRSILTEILVPADGPGEGSGYARLEQRKALALPMVCVSSWVHLTGNTVERCRIAMAPVGVGPVRAKAAEEYLAGREITDETLNEAGKLVLHDAAPRESLIRGSKKYREEVLPVMAVRALREAIDRAALTEKEVTQL